MLTPVVAYILYSVFALGAVGLYLAMPRLEGSHARSGALIGAASILGLMVFVGVRMLADDGLAVFFYAFGAVAIFAAARVVTHPKPVYSAVYFLLVILCIAALLVVQQAEFLAVALLMIYAGAILVTYVFVIMLAQQPEPELADVKAREPFLAILVAFVATGALAGRITELPSRPEPPAPYMILVSDAGADDNPVPDTASETPETGNTLAVGNQMFGAYVVSVELAGVLLLVAMVGAVAMVRKRLPTEKPTEMRPPPGTIGRQVPPY